MTLAEFTAMVVLECNKGTSLSTYIPDRILLALQRLERRYALKYMETLGTVTIALNGSSAAVPTGFKNPIWLRYTASDGYYIYLPQVDAEDVIRDSGCKPTGWWLESGTTFQFDNTQDEELVLDILYNKYSSSIPDNHWMLANGADCLLAETMRMLATLAKEPSWLEKYGDMLQSASQDLFTADMELRNSSRDYVMVPEGERFTTRPRYPNDDGV